MTKQSVRVHIDINMILALILALAAKRQLAFTAPYIYTFQPACFQASLVIVLFVIALKYICTIIERYIFYY